MKTSKPRRARGKLPATFQGAKVVRAVGMKNFDKFLEKKALDQFIATQPMYIVVDNSILERPDFADVHGFLSEAEALKCARAKGNGNIDQRVLKVVAQTLVIATDNEL